MCKQRCLGTLIAVQACACGCSTVQCPATCALAGRPLAYLHVMCAALGAPILCLVGDVTAVASMARSSVAACRKSLRPVEAPCCSASCAWG